MCNLYDLISATAQQEPAAGHHLHSRPSGKRFVEYGQIHTELGAQLNSVTVRDESLEPWRVHLACTEGCECDEHDEAGVAPCRLRVGEPVFDGPLSPWISVVEHEQSWCGPSLVSSCGDALLQFVEQVDAVVGTECGGCPIGPCLEW